MSNYFQDKKVVIAGGCSFIASHTIEKLLTLGVKEIIAVDDLSSGAISNLPKDKRVSLQIGNLRNYDVAKDRIKGDVCLDFSSIHGGRGFVGTNHEVAISDNFVLNTNVLRAAVANGVQRIAFSSSACAYDVRRQMDETQEFRIPESWDNHDASLFPDGMYGLSKAVHERVLRAYQKDGLIETSICRFFTVFGPRMKENHFICATIAKAFARTDPFYVWGSPDVIRNFTPVQNTRDGFLLAAATGNGEIYNIGLEDRITIGYAVARIFELMDWFPNDLIYQPDKPVGIRNRVADCTKAKTELGWQPTVTFEQGLADTIDWYISTHKQDDVRRDLEKLLVSR